MRPHLRLRLRGLMAATAVAALLLGLFRWTMAPSGAADARRIALAHLSAHPEQFDGHKAADVRGVDVRPPTPKDPCWSVRFRLAEAGGTARAYCTIRPDGAVTLIGVDRTRRVGPVTLIGVGQTRRVGPYTPP
jgi:hypothetical protein